MREILFRGKSLDKSGAWVLGSLIHRTDFYGDPCDDYFILYGGEFDCDYYDADRVDPKTVGQFTGLTDKNGKRIFEGDIVKFTDSPFGYSYTGSVCFYKGSFCIHYTYWGEDCFHRIGKTEEWRDMGASGTITFEYEIIGNIHDNPELIKNEHSTIL